MIRSSRDKNTERLFARGPVKRLDASLQRTALRKLEQLDAAESLEDLAAIPGNHLEKLKGDRAGQYSIRVNGQWRVCFRWEDGDAHDVEITDYH
jgi:proteic killer suppression protein